MCNKESKFNIKPYNILPQKMSGMTVNARNPGEDSQHRHTTNWGWLLVWRTGLLVRVVERSRWLSYSTLWLPHRKRSRRLADRKPVIYRYGHFIYYRYRHVVPYPVVDDRILQAQTLRAEALHYLAAGAGVTGG